MSNATTTTNGVSDGLPRDPDDFFHETRMSFGDHIEELRAYLWRAIAGLGICMVLGFVFDGIGSWTGWALYPGAKTGHLRASYWVKRIRSEPVLPGQPLKFGIGVPLMQIIQDPVEEALVTFHKNQELKATEQAKESGTAAATANEPAPIELTFTKEDLQRMGMNPGKEFDKVTVTALLRPLDVERVLSPAKQVMRPRALTTLSVQEALVVYFKVSLVSGLVIASPWVFWQIWSFVAAGLYPNEKRLVHVYLPFSLFLFLAGVFVCQFLVMPQAVSAMLWFNEWLGMTPDLRLNEWLSFAIWMPIVFGVSFQTPLVMLFMAKLGIADVPWFASKRRYAFFALAVFSALITPSPDAVSMLCMMIPMCLLYELGIILIKLQPPQPFIDEMSDTDELVEV